MIENKEIEVSINKFKEDFQGVYLGEDEKIENLFGNARELAKNSASVEEFKRKMSISFLKEISLMLKDDELDNNDFFLDALKSSEFWRPLAKLVLLKRIDELKNCKVLKKGKKYDVSGLKDSFFGKFIMNKLNFSRRSVLTEGEYSKITNAIKKLRYEVPIVVQPTETEKFFEK